MTTYYKYSPNSLSYKALEMTRDLQKDPALRAQMAQSEGGLFAKAHLYDDGNPFELFLTYPLIEACSMHLANGKRRAAAVIDNRAGGAIRAWNLQLHDAGFSYREKEELWDLFLQAIEKPDECWPGLISGGDFQNVKQQLLGIINHATV